MNVVYEYDINSNVPAYIWNVPAIANSFAAYLQGRLNQEDVVLPVDADGNSLVPEDCDASCSIDDPEAGHIESQQVSDGRYRFETERGQVGYIEVVDDTTYVSYEASELPLTALIRQFREPAISSPT